MPWAARDPQYLSQVTNVRLRHHCQTTRQKMIKRKNGIMVRDRQIDRLVGTEDGCNTRAEEMTEDGRLGQQNSEMDRQPEGGWR